MKLETKTGYYVNSTNTIIGRIIYIPEGYNVSDFRLVGEQEGQDILDKLLDEIETATPEQDAVYVAKITQEKAVMMFITKQVQETAQSFDDATSLDNQALFPFWETDITVQAGQKYQHFNKSGDIVLYKVIQTHTTQSDWKPDNTPALWVRVGFDNEILEWTQPEGAHDAYQIGDKVKFNGKIYESLIANNTYSPTDYPQGWKEL